MKDQQYDDCVQHMSETLYSRCRHFIDKKDSEIANAIIEEWIVDEQDPEDGVYEFTFLEDLTNV